MFKPVYVCRATYDANHVQIIPAELGIVKVYGCYFFTVAKKTRNSTFAESFLTAIYRELHMWNSKLLPKGCHEICPRTCKRRYGTIPKRGEAYLVEEKRDHILWTRVDEDLHLLTEYGNIIKE